MRTMLILASSLYRAVEDFSDDSDSESGVGGVGGENNNTFSFLHSDWYFNFFW